MLKLIEIALGVAAIYSGAMWLILCAASLKTGTDYERETFHLGLCFILAAGILGLILRGG
jgi:hypothetical protein